MEASRQMLLTGDLITPQFNALVRFDKPPLLYWVQAISMALLGPTVGAARLPSILCGLLLCVAVGWTTIRFGLPSSPRIVTSTSAGSRWRISKETVMCTCMALGLNILVFVWSSLALSDMLNTTMMSLSLLAFFHG